MKQLCAIRTLIVLGWILCCGAARASKDAPDTDTHVAATEQGTRTWEHVAFPSIPNLPVEKNNLMEVLAVSCQELPNLTVPPATFLDAPKQKWEAERDAPYTGTTDAAKKQHDNDVKEAKERLREYAAVEQKLKPWTPADLVNLVSELKQVCEAIHEKKLLTGAQLELIRTLRDKPTLRSIVGIWVAERFEEDGILGAVTQGKAESSQLLPGGSVASISDTLIRGLAEFLATRAKQEALLYLREQLTKKLCTVLGEQFFPRVCQTIRALDDSQSLEGIGSVLRAAAASDLERLPDVTLAYVEHQNPRLANYTFGGRLGYQMYRELAAGREPGEVFANVGSIDPLSCEMQGCRQVAGAVRFTSAFVYALLQGTKDGKWPTKLDEFEGQLPAAMVAVALLAESRVGGGKMTAEMLAAVVDSPAELVKHLRVAQSSYEKLVEQLEGNNAPEGDERRERVAQVLERAVTAFGAQAPLLVAVFRPNQDVQALMGTLRTGSEIAADLLARDYAGAVVELSAELKRRMQGTKDEAFQQVRPFLPLIVEIATAENSEGVAAALDAYAAPVGSYKAKYRRDSVAINGMVGALGGIESIDSHAVSGQSPFVAGFAAFGVHASMAIGPDGGDNCFHVGALVTLLDLGALTTRRFEEELESDDSDGTAGDDAPQAEAQPQLSFAQVFSPGAYLTVGLGGSPFVFGLGVSYAPDLRQVTDEGEQFEVSAFRYGAFLAVDVPILPLN